ncbi:MAG: 4-(cytidine 5'-diphospho)-2-C-methyl-D-erythritol kinase [Alphaproteobacteria bacterium]|nr:4-(cytidine 5'-diphospho)-2-C-methyl-D-erythritol kinase [Alphaproteobacteria bacterium]
MTSKSAQKDVSIFAPAKVNLSLHITGKREDGYHLLQSIIAFSNFGDEIKISPSKEFIFTQKNTFPGSPDQVADNIVVQAAQGLSKLLNKPLHCHIHLIKTIPIGAGLGGGSSDAAATIRGLLEFWEIFIPAEKLQNLLLSLGADVPVCYYNLPCLVEGVGEIIKPIPSFSPLPALLIFPNKFCSTKKIFTDHNEKFSKKFTLPETNFFDFIRSQKNDLTAAAIKNIPEIEEILNALSAMPSCQLSRMSGSGSACFGVFNNQNESLEAAENIQKKWPNWWVRPIMIE